MQMKKRYGISGFLGYKAEIGNLVITHPGFNGLVMKVRLILMLVLVVLLASVFDVQAQSVYYVRADATGAENGSDWNNAYTSLPSTLVRGATYYIADGSYGDYTFDDAVSGSTLITVKKATASDHGIDTGWSSSYGDGQAIIDGIISIDTSYITVDGQTKYGIKIVRPDLVTSATQAVRFFSAQSHITFRYVEMSGPGGATDYSYHKPMTAFGVSPSGSPSNITISHCSIHGFSTAIYIVRVDNFTLEYSDIYDIRSNKFTEGGVTYDVHDNLIYIIGKCDGIIRYNKFHNWRTEGIFFTGSYGDEMGPWEIYGNLFYHTSTYTGMPRAIESGLHRSSTLPGSTVIMKVYNNTFANLWSTYRIVPPYKAFEPCDDLGPRCEWRNNLFYKGGIFQTCPNATYSNNTTATSDPFISMSTGDFRLAAPTAAGYTLSSPYNVDMLNNVRGADGNLDRGALEYGGSPEGLSPPTGVRIISQ